jgi:hypothetical protein
MGLTQSTYSTANVVVPTPAVNTTPVTITPTVETQLVTTVNELVTDTSPLSTIVEESKTEEKEVPQTPNTTPTETVADATTGTEVFARYVKPVGTKVEVAPVEVTPMTDVVKKNRNKKKNKNGKKD